MIWSRTVHAIKQVETMRKYETILILRPELTEEQMNEEVKKVEAFIQDKGARDLKVEEWGRREIAFEMQKVRHGWYVCLKYASDNSGLNEELTRSLRINDSYLKFQTHRLNDKVRKFKGNPRSNSAEGAEA